MTAVRKWKERNKSHDVRKEKTGMTAERKWQERNKSHDVRKDK